MVVRSTEDVHPVRRNELVAARDKEPRESVKESENIKRDIR